MPRFLIFYGSLILGGVAQYLCSDANDKLEVEVKLCWIPTIDFILFAIATHSVFMGIPTSYSHFVLALAVYLYVETLDNPPVRLKRSTGPVLKKAWKVFRAKAIKDLAMYFFPSLASLGQ